MTPAPSAAPAAVRRLLVTGARGFLGGTVGAYCARQGVEVLGVGRAASAPVGWPGRYVHADASGADLAPLIREFAPDIIFHGAGTASVAASMQQPAEDLRATVLVLANVLDGARRSGMQPRVFLPSSAAVYGNPATLPVSEDAPLHPISPYGFHKVMCELLAREYTELHGIPTVCLRVFSTFGWRQRRLLVWEVFEQARRGDAEVWLQGTGEETRDFLAAEDLAAVVHQLAALSLHTLPPVLNVASGLETPIRDLAGWIIEACDAKATVRCHGRVRPGDPRRWCADVQRLRALLPAWQPVELKAGIASCVDRWRHGPQSPAD